METAPNRGPLGLTFEDACARIAIEAVTSGLLYTDTQGRVVYSNPRAAELLERRPEELYRVPIDHLVDRMSGLIDLYKRSGGRPEVTVRLPNGNERVFAYSLASVPASAGVPAGFVMWFQDITHYARLRKERDRLLQRAVIAEMLPSILHNLRNPLASITTAVELLLEEATEPEVLADLKNVLREAQRMDLGFQGFAIAGRDLWTMQASDIADVIRGAAHALAPHVEAAGSRLDLEIASLPPLKLNPGVIRGMVFNLVSYGLARARGKTLRLWFRQPQAKALELGISIPGSSFEIEPSALDSSAGASVAKYVELILCKRAAEAAGGTVMISVVSDALEITVSIPLERA
jgi:nitrogen-specific signal transduction histidine kinase